jgi:hypothetical protein
MVARVGHSASHRRRHVRRHSLARSRQRDRLPRPPGDRKGRGARALENDCCGREADAILGERQRRHGARGGCRARARTAAFSYASSSSRRPDRDAAEWSSSSHSDNEVGVVAGGCSATRATARCACRSSRIRPAASASATPATAAKQGLQTGRSRRLATAGLGGCASAEFRDQRRRLGETCLRLCAGIAARSRVAACVGSSSQRTADDVTGASGMEHGAPALAGDCCWSSAAAPDRHSGWLSLAEAKRARRTCVGRRAGMAVVRRRVSLVLDRDVSLRVRAASVVSATRFRGC